MVILIYVVAVAFLVMGVSGLVWPARLVETVGGRVEGAMGRNEVRAVYGGFGVFIAGALVAAPHYPTYGPGIVLCVAVAVFGMVAGRVVSAIVDRGIAPYMLGVTVVEMIGGGMLLASLGSVG